MITEKRTSHRTVAFLFFGTYFGGFVLWLVWSLLSAGSSIFSRAGFYFMAWGVCLFPSGLFGFVTNSSNLMEGLAIFGYGIYAVIFSFAFWLRKYWQTCLLWVMLVSLVIFNYAGCNNEMNHIADHAAF
jgi:D-alanyl-lipoteichoic acid acyltransferase DltB (MBOAT superfamily)